MRRRSISPPSLDAESEELRPNSAIIDLHELHPLLAQHPFVVQATRLPVSQQSALKAFLQDMDCIVRERDELKKDYGFCCLAVGVRALA